MDPRTTRLQTLTNLLLEGFAAIIPSENGGCLADAASLGREILKLINGESEWPPEYELPFVGGPLGL